MKLLGHFLQDIDSGEMCELRQDEALEGQPVAAVQDMETLRHQGLANGLSFGIATGRNTVICRCHEHSANIDSPLFTVKELPMDAFLSGGAHLFSYDAHGGWGAASLSRAANLVGKRYTTLCSYPGDDFVAECVTGEFFADILSRESRVGWHWVTPQNLQVKKIIDNLAEIPDKLHVSKLLDLIPLSRETTVILSRDMIPLPVKAVLNKIKLKDLYTKLYNSLKDIELVSMQHHGISIENRQMLHFSSCRVAQDEFKIKADSVEDFLNWRFIECKGGPIIDQDYDPDACLTTRNRAVWLFCTSSLWDNYNTFTNNDEDFASICRTGDKCPKQLNLRVLVRISQFINAIPRVGPLGYIVAGISLLSRLIPHIAEKEYNLWQNIELAEKEHELLMLKKRLGTSS